MPTIQLQIVTGPGTMRREVFGESPVKFGREADNHVVLTEPTASRHHGELRLVESGWVLVNLSPNGTRVNGRNVTRKPHPLRDRDTVAIGDATVFQVVLDPVRAEAEPAAPAADEAERGWKPKLWIGIGVYLLIMLGLVVFLSTLRKDGADGAPIAAMLTPEAIAAEIAKPPSVARTDPAEARKHLAEATERFQKLTTSDRNLYETYRAYQLAQAYMGKPLDGIDQRRFDSVRHELTDEVTTLYRRAYGELRQSRFREAQRLFDELTRRAYPDRDSAIYANAQQQLRAATERLKRQRR